MGKPSKKHKKSKKESNDSKVSKNQPKTGQKKIRDKPNGFKVFILHLVTLASIFLFANLTLNERWLDRRISRYLEIIPKQMEMMDVEKRKLSKYRYEYKFVKFLRKRLSPKDTLLIPPQTYLVANTFERLKTNHWWTFPQVFYYHSDGLICVNMRNTDSLVNNATHTVYVDKNSRIQILPLDNQRRLSQVKNTFNKYNLKKTLWNRREAKRYYLKQKQ